MTAVLIVIYLAVYFAVCGAYFQLAKKAGRDDIAWFAFIPILNSILQLKLIKQSAWWILMSLVPIANIVFAIIWQVKLLNAFGKSGAYVLFILISPVYVILWMVWGYSSSTVYYLNNTPQNPTGPTASF
ncbi:DUF5684 domain-containing protein [Paenibacillus sp. VCA1]|uniref:DUF5684 domain-containing protein n=1 Tax=Paenibacillus sp. VCA1 TaxID=3039148 RepID=UPI00287197BF|nr:DUF5684 domain-containing protein [Paenibacillus sp. VCA1]MDR9857025.1 DUF5684 domain-containing protein [Paenibacillus sp. VCA1]